MDPPTGVKKRSGKGKKSKQQQHIGVPAYTNRDGSVQSQASVMEKLTSAPFGPGNTWNNMPKIVRSMFWEFVCVFGICVILPSAVATPLGPDPLSRAIFLGFVAGISIWGALELGRTSMELPRHISPGASWSQLWQGKINLWFFIGYLIVGFLASLAASGVIYATATSIPPAVGGANRTDLAGAFFVQLLATCFIALVVLVPNSRDNDTPIDSKPLIYGAVTFLVIMFSYLKFGLWTFNGYIYFTSAIALTFLGGGAGVAVDPFNNVVPGITGASDAIQGIGAMFILVDLLAWWLVFLVDWFLMYLRYREEEGPAPAPPRREDSEYHSMNDEYSNYDDYELAQQQKRDRERSRKRTISSKNARNNSPATTEHFNIDELDPDIFN